MLEMDHESSDHIFIIRSANNIWYVGDRTVAGNEQEMMEWFFTLRITCQQLFLNMTSKMNQTYEIEQNQPFLGRGKYGIVYPGYNKCKPDEKVALKVINVDNYRMGDVIAELLPRQLRNHPGIIKIFDILRHDEQQQQQQQQQHRLMDHDGSYDDENYNPAAGGACSRNNEPNLIVIVMERQDCEYVRFVVVVAAVTIFFLNMNSLLTFIQQRHHRLVCKLPERLTKFIMFQVATALAYLERNNIVHGDLKVG